MFQRKTKASNPIHVSWTLDVIRAHDEVAHECCRGGGMLHVDNAPSGSRARNGEEREAGAASQTRSCYRRRTVSVTRSLPAHGDNSLPDSFSPLH